MKTASNPIEAAYLARIRKFGLILALAFLPLPGFASGAKVSDTSISFNPPAIVNGSNGPELLLVLNNWKGGTLVYATNLTGPWYAAAPTGTNNEFLVPIYPTGSQYYYRAEGSNLAPAAPSPKADITPPLVPNTNYIRFYATTSFWNTPIATNPVIDPNSAAIVQASLTPYASNAVFGNSKYGVAMAYGTLTNPLYRVTATLYSSPSTAPGKQGVLFPIPLGTAAALGTDGHLAVAYQTFDGSPYAGMELDMWQARFNPTNKTWSASTVVLSPLFGWGAVCPPGKGFCGGADAAGFCLLGGAVRPEDISRGHIYHALAMATPHNLSNYVACPATATDGTASAPALPEGALIQLDPTYNVDAQNWPQWVKLIAHALQEYGAYNRDTCSTLSIYGVTDQNAGVPTWTSVGVPESGGMLNMLPWSSMRVIKIVKCN